MSSLPTPGPLPDEGRGRWLATATVRSLPFARRALERE